MLLCLVVIFEITMLTVAIDNNEEIEEQSSADPFYINQPELLTPQDSNAQVNQSLKNHLILQAQKLSKQAETQSPEFTDIATSDAKNLNPLTSRRISHANGNINISPQHMTDLTAANDPFKTPKHIKTDTTNKNQRISNAEFEQSNSEIQETKSSRMIRFSERTTSVNAESAHIYSIAVSIANSSKDFNTNEHDPSSPGASIFAALVGRNTNQNDSHAKQLPDLEISGDSYRISNGTYTDLESRLDVNSGCGCCGCITSECEYNCCRLLVFLMGCLLAGVLAFFFWYQVCAS